MAKHGGIDVVFLIDGYNFLAAKLKSLSLKVSSLVEQSDGLGDGNEIYTPVGKTNLTLTQGEAFFDDAALSLHAAMANNMGTSPSVTPRIGCVGIMGNTIGAVCYGLAGLFSTAYEGALQLTKLTKANAEHLMQNVVERGRIVLNLAAQTASFDTTASPTDFTTDPSQTTIPITSNSAANPSVVTTPVPHGLTNGQKVFISGSNSTPSINGDLVATVISPTSFSLPVNVTVAGTSGSFVLSNTVNGGSAYQQVTAFSGFSGYVGKIRQSADNVTYVDLATFANVTGAPNAQRVTVAPATTVNRYLVYTGTPTGAGSVTPFAMFARSL